MLRTIAFSLSLLLATTGLALAGLPAGAADATQKGNPPPGTETIQPRGSFPGHQANTAGTARDALKASLPERPARDTPAEAHESHLVELRAWRAANRPRPEPPVAVQDAVLLTQDFDGSWSTTSPPTGWEIAYSSPADDNDWHREDWDDPYQAGYEYWPSETFDNVLTSPVIDCGAHANVSLQAWVDYSYYSGSYTAVIEGSTDGGTTWPYTVRTYTNDYNGTENFTLTWADNQSNVRLRWRGSGYTWNMDWWFIDDVLVQGDMAVTDDVGVSAITAPVGGFCWGDTIPFAAVVSNFGTAGQSGVPVLLSVSDQADSVVHLDTVLVDVSAGDTATATFDGWVAYDADVDYDVAFATDLAGDQNPANDDASGGFQTSLYAGGAVFSHDTTFENGGTWNSAGGELATLFVAEAGPKKLTKVGVWLTGFLNTTVTEQINFYAVAPDGNPGDSLASVPAVDFNIDVYPAMGYTEMDLTPYDIVIEDTAFFVSWHQVNFTTTHYLAMDQDDPVLVHNDKMRHPTYQPAWADGTWDATADFGITAWWSVPYYDAEMVSVNAPPESIAYEEQPIVPQVTVRNAGFREMPVGTPVRFTIDDGTDAAVWDTVVSSPALVQGDTAQVDFPEVSPFLDGGEYTCRTNTGHHYDPESGNDSLSRALHVDEPTTVHDVTMLEILVPAGTDRTGRDIYPRVKVRNIGEEAETFDVRVVVDDGADVEVYNGTATVAALGVGEEREVEFATAWNEPAGDTGFYYVTARTELAGDAHPENDTLTGEVFLTDMPPWPEGWNEVAPMPLMPSGRAVKRGGWLTMVDNQLYAGKGYKTQDFFRYDPLADSWTTLEPIPFGERSGRQREAKKGSRGESDGERHIYYTAGNNTLTFFRYDVMTDSWKQLADVPEGPRRKRVKGGNDMQYVVVADTGWVYLMKGYKTEFYRFNTVTGFWDTLPDMPHVRKDKWDKGSWLVYDGDRTIYAHQSKYYDRITDHHYMFRYDIPGDSWYTQALTGMPLYGLHSGRIRKKKSKDGGCAALYDGDIYSLKGGNTQQFWKYVIARDSWVELDTFPNYGSTGRKRRVKYGADIVEYGGGAFFALKGNKTRELWRYVIPMGMTMGARPERSGVMSDRSGPPAGVTCAPNPFNGGFATVRYGLPQAGPARVSVFDVTGRSVMSRTLAASRTGALRLDLRSLGAGIYLLRLESGGQEATTKLVINR